MMPYIQARRFRFCLGGTNALSKQNRISKRIFFRIFKRLKTHRLPPPRHVLAISNGIVNLPEYISTNSDFQLEKNEIVIEY